MAVRLDVASRVMRVDVKDTLMEKNELVKFLDKLET